ncbi:hypothetical protein [Hahella ganghwensis]|uniref:hypothetical protein n=1 Tax=Hahella ganghwensis TaxID=286420 RepID=UPI00037BC85F|nr:hypothetical protein [Hahella ganghwensis]
MKSKVFSAVVAAFLFYASSAIADYNVGLFTRDISPSVFEGLTSCMGGFGGPYSRCGNTKVHDPLSVRSLYIADSDSEIVIISIDSVGLGDQFTADIRESTALWLDISPQQVFISATHTHSGPDLQGLWGGVNEFYKARIAFNAVYASIEAKYLSEPSELFALETQANVVNRRGLEDVDSTVTTLLFNNLRTGKPNAVLVNMSAHPTIIGEGNREFSSDYVGYLRRRLETNLGGNAIFVNGILGDAAPRDPSNNSSVESFEAAELFGNQVADRILDRILDATPVRGDLSISGRQFSHQVTNSGLLELVDAGLLDVKLDSSQMIHAPISLLTFGDKVSAITVPGELLTTIGRRYQNAMKSDYKLVLGLTNGSYGYFIPSNEFGTVPGRVTEERASIDILAGDNLELITLDLIDTDEPY